MTPAGAPASRAVPRVPEVNTHREKREEQSKTHLKTHQPSCIFLPGRVDALAEGLLAACNSQHSLLPLEAPALPGCGLDTCHCGDRAPGAWRLKSLLWASCTQLFLSTCRQSLKSLLSKPCKHSPVTFHLRFLLCPQQPHLVRRSSTVAPSTDEETEAEWETLQLQL